MPGTLPNYEIRPPQPEEFGPTGEVVAAAFGDSGPTVANLVVELRRLWGVGRGFELVAIRRMAFSVTSASRVAIWTHSTGFGTYLS